MQTVFFFLLRFKVINNKTIKTVIFLIFYVGLKFNLGDKEKYRLRVPDNRMLRNISGPKKEARTGG
jgi:hypothetical protein